MVDNRSHQNIVINEGDVLRFMPNQIYIVNESLRFENGTLLSENTERGDTMIKLKDISCHEENRTSCISRKGEEEVALFQILWNQPDSKFQAQFMPLNDNILTDHNNFVPQNIQRHIPIIEIDDSDGEDVVFVNEYSQQDLNVENATEERKELTKTAHLKEEKKPRRNPSRKARNSKFGKRSSDENIYEEDFCMLDSSDDDSSADDEISETPTTKEEVAQNCEIVKDLKKWPVNGLHERPEYNIVTRKIEKFDYTIREIQNNAKKPKLDEPKNTKPVKKPATKKYVPKKKVTKGKITSNINSKVSFHSLKDLIEENYKNLSIFMKNLDAQNEKGLHTCHNVVLGYKINENNISTNALHIVPDSSSSEDHEHTTCLKNYESLSMNQSRLFSLISVAFGETYDGIK